MTISNLSCTTCQYATHCSHVCPDKLGVATKRRNEITPLGPPRIKVIQLSLTPQGLKEKLIKGFFLYIYIYIYIWVVLTGTAWCPLTTEFFYFFLIQFFTFFTIHVIFFSFAGTIQNFFDFFRQFFFLSFLHLTSTRLCWLTFSYIYIYIV